MLIDSRRSWAMDTGKENVLFCMDSQPPLTTKRIKAVLPVLLLLVWIRTSAQPDPTIRGRVVDLDTGKPLSFVTVSAAGGQFSNQTNTDGYFMLTVPNPFKNDTVLLTVIGRPSVRIPFALLTPKDSVIRLDSLPSRAKTFATEAYFAEERPFRAADTLLKVVASIARNYSSKPTLLRGFYRETIRTQQGEAYNLYAEGQIDVYKPSYYFVRKNDQVHFVKGRRKPLTTLNIPVLTPGPWGSTMLDIVKYQEFLFRNGRINRDYVFEPAGETTLDNQPVYTIHFRPRNRYVPTGYFTGNLFLSKPAV